MLPGPVHTCGACDVHVTCGCEHVNVLSWAQAVGRCMHMCMHVHASAIHAHVMCMEVCALIRMSSVLCVQCVYGGMHINKSVKKLTTLVTWSWSVRK